MKIAIACFDQRKKINSGMRLSDVDETCRHILRKEIGSDALDSLLANPSCEFVFVGIYTTPDGRIRNRIVASGKPYEPGDEIEALHSMAASLGIEIERKLELV